MVSSPNTALESPATAIQVTAMDRLLTEKQFHDRQAHQRAAAGVRLQFDDDAYLDHETWIRPAFEQLAKKGTQLFSEKSCVPFFGLRVLDYGCGHGMAAVVMARAGAHVTAFDLSGGYIEEASQRARTNGVDVHFLQANAEELPFADGSFDRVWGCAILHHLDLERAGAELRRVLSPGGRAVFCEPWGGNLVLNFARRRLAYPQKHRTPDEEPLTKDHVYQLREIFPRVHVRGFQLVSMARRVVRARRLRRQLDWCDHMLLQRVPALEQFCRYVVLTLQVEA
jgi:2-polyprenyl-3-methyl-5-hydroxy-6-metoxy-1,4-benzoquinol methylase